MLKKPASLEQPEFQATAFLNRGGLAWERRVLARQGRAGGNCSLFEHPRQFHVDWLCEEAGVVSLIASSSLGPRLGYPSLLLFPMKPSLADRSFQAALPNASMGRSIRAQVFAKGDRLRLEYKYAIRTDYGYAAIEIIRLDQSEAWYLLA